MQLFIFAPILAYLLYRLGNPFMLVVVALMAVSIGWTYWLFMDLSLIFKLSSLK